MSYFHKAEPIMQFMVIFIFMLFFCLCVCCMINNNSAIMYFHWITKQNQPRPTNTNIITGHWKTYCDCSHNRHNKAVPLQVCNESTRQKRKKWYRSASKWEETHCVPEIIITFLWIVTASDIGVLNIHVLSWKTSVCFSICSINIHLDVKSIKAHTHTLI